MTQNIPNRYSELDDTSFDAEELLNPGSTRKEQSAEPDVRPAEPLRDSVAAGAAQSASPRFDAPADNPAVTPAADDEFVPKTRYEVPVDDSAQQPVSETSAPRASAVTREVMIGESTLQKLLMFSGIVLFFLAA